MSIFETCVRLHKNGFPDKRRDDSHFFVRPDMLIRMDQLGALRDVVSKRMGLGDQSIFDQLIYYPTIEDLWDAVQPSEIRRMQNGSIMVYREDHFDNDVIAQSRYDGPSLWEALANFYNYWAENRDKLIPPIDITQLAKEHGTSN